MRRRWVSGPGAHHWAALGCLLTLPTLGLAPAWFVWTDAAGWRVSRHLAWMAAAMALVGVGAAFLHLIGVACEVAGWDGATLCLLARLWGLVALAVPLVAGVGHLVAWLLPRPPPKALRHRVVLPPWKPPPPVARTTFLVPEPTGPTAEVAR